MQAFKASGAKEKILQRIRKALEHKVQQPFANIDNQSNIYANNHQGLEMQFAQAFTELGGHFVYCENQKELVDNLRNLIDERGWKNLICWDEKMMNLFQENNFQQIQNHKTIDKTEPSDAGITGCEFLIARTGTVTLSSRQESGRVLAIFPPHHIVVAYSNQLVGDMKDAIQQIKTKYPTQLPSLINFETGPSRTADIEKTLVVGVHGPKEIFVFLVDENLEE